MKDIAPPRSTLLQDAMLHLKQRKGASLAQIRKHLEANYEEKLDGSNKKLLSSALSGMVQTGKVKKLGNMYKLSSNSNEDENLTKGRRRLPVGYCKSHHRPHFAGSKRKRSRKTRRHRRRHHRRRHHRRRKTHRRRPRRPRRHHRRRHHKRRRSRHRRHSRRRRH